MSWNGWSPEYYIPSFVEISLPVPEKRIFTIYGHGGHLCHVTSIVSSDFHFPVPESFHTKFGPDWRSSSSSSRCLLLLPFRSLAAILSEKSTVITFPHKKPKLPNLTLS